MQPEMSVVVITPDNFATIAKTIGYLHEQNVRDRLEIVIAAPTKVALQLQEDVLRAFHSFKVIEVGEITSTARARAAGVFAASAPVVAFVEDHSFPASGWAEALIGAHRQAWAAVGPAMVNANPLTLASWVSLLTEYAPWLDPCPAGVRYHLPGHNASYKRALLVQYGDALEAMIDAESVLQWDLRSQGHELYLESAAKTMHYNFSAGFSWLPLRFNGGRLFAAARARNWSALRRMLYCLASPLIPFVRLMRIVKELRAPGRRRDLLPRIVPLLLVSLVFDAAGELTGYALGAGDSMRKLSDMEFHRHRYLAKTDFHAE
ncbi:MAG: hypothetical protein H7Z74_03020 [Anaerolineae bacterium]|nr:hypothetical protein [Gemmatimonadaceae bacterium]